MGKGTAISEKSELDIIGQINDLLGIYVDCKDVIKGIGDDCAVLRKEKKNCYLVSTDALIEGVHFDLSWHPPFLLGRKIAAVNLSDIAAMGGQPRFALLSVAFPGTAPSWLDDFLLGFKAILKEYNTYLVGGDTVKSSNDLCINITIIGEAAGPDVLYRSSAEPGDLVLVSGCLGDAAAGLALCRAGLVDAGREQWRQLVAAHLDPQPQVELGRILSESGHVHAMMDISDGLATDLSHICTASTVGAEVFQDALPVSGELQSAAAQLQKPTLDWVLQGGEDYQLLFTVSPDHEQELRSLVADKTAREIFTIGRIIEGRGVYLCSDKRRRDISYRGYDHFKG